MTNPEQMLFRSAFIAAITILIGAIVAAPAHADDQASIADLNARGVPQLIPPAREIGGGYQVCGMMRNGMSPEVAAQQFGMLNQWGPAIVDAAQHDLCPDTLH